MVTSTCTLADALDLADSDSNVALPDPIRPGQMGRLDRRLEPVIADLAQVPADFKMSLKVTEDLTVRRFPNIARSGARAGKMNEHFLNPDLFVASFLGPLQPYKGQIGTLIFEFGHFHPGDWERGRDFVAALDEFFGRLPRDWDYSVEVRNPNLLQPEYFDVLRRHRVAHTFNSWSRMPPVNEQLAMPDSFTSDFATARFLLTPGRDYQQAVDAFSPYKETKEPNADARAALIDLLLTPAKPGRPGRRFLYVNNRLEGNALWTIYAAISGLMKPKQIFSEGGKS